MADYGTQYADKKQEQIEKRLKKVYQSAYVELKKEFEQFAIRSKKAEETKRKQVEAGKISEADFQDWRRGQQFIGRQWEAKVNHAADILLHARQEAAKIVNDEKMDVFAENANYEAYKLEKDANLSFGFGVYDADAVGRLIKEQPELLPRKVVNGEKQKAWSRQQIATAVTQGIIQGDPVDKVAGRIALKTASADMGAMVRYARTAITGAQNGGRMETMHRAQNMGIKVQKKWLATLDKRTRDSHAILDGQVQDIDKPFHSIYGKIMYPGDLDAESEADIWNCRCTLEYVYPDFSDLEENVERYDQEEGKPIQDMTYTEWKKKNEPQEQPKVRREKPLKGNAMLMDIKKRIAEHSGDWATDDIISVGGDVHTFIEQELAEKINAIETELQETLARLEELEKNNQYTSEWAELYDKKFELVRKKKQAQADATLDALSRLREFGGITKKNISEQANFDAWPTKKTAMKERMMQAMNCYPSSWLERSRQYGTSLKPHWSTARAYYSIRDGEIRTSDRTPSNIHELGHRMESCVPGILKAEKEFYDKRTAGYELEWLGTGYRKDEKARKDKFTDPYMGKDYGGSAYELVSMGFEAVLAPIPRHKLDDEMRNWILGLLAAL